MTMDTIKIITPEYDPNKFKKSAQKKSPGKKESNKKTSAKKN